MRPKAKAQSARKKTANVRHAIAVNSRKTCVSLENEFWQGLHQIAEQKHTTVDSLVAKIDRQRDTCNLSSAIRLFVYNYFVKRIGV